MSEHRETPAIDSLDAVEFLMRIEEVFELPEEDVPAFGSRPEFIDLIYAQLSNLRPNQNAIAILNKIAKTRNQPELVQDLGGCWTREQIAAIVGELWKD